jgi:redox-sensitive bicupin YhaK (pirin superfamily)
MLTLRKASDRGAANHGWLKSFHTFSFANYRNPKEQGFSDLLVINDDRVAAGKVSASTHTATWRFSLMCSKVLWNTKTPWALAR